MPSTAASDERRYTSHSRTNPSSSPASPARSSRLPLLRGRRRRSDDDEGADIKTSTTDVVVFRVLPPRKRLRPSTTPNAIAVRYSGANILIGGGDVIFVIFDDLHGGGARTAGRRRLTPTAD
jgi:hypothetical protein